MSGQSSLLILMGIVVIIVGGWFFTSFYQTRLQESSMTELEIIFRKIGTYLDSIKGFSKNALVLSIHKGSSEIGTSGLTFYCNAPTPPTTRQMRYELSSRTLELLNDYLKNYPLSEPLVVVDIKDFSCVDTPVEGLEEGLIDENFTANAYDSKIDISIKENNVSSKNELFEIIPENRFWFLYRKLRDWSLQEGINFEDRVCDCLTNSELPKRENVMTNCEDWPNFEKCFKDAIEDTEEDMEELINDPYVSCKGKPTCCYGEKEPCLTDVKDEQCGVWGGGTQCSECTLLSDEELCIERISASSEKSRRTYEKTTDIISFNGKDEEQSLSVISFSPDYICEGECEFYETGYINVKAQFTCTDKKYQLSLPFPEDRYLKFTIDTKISLMRNGINIMKVPCEWQDEDHTVCGCKGQYLEDWCEGECYTIEGTVTTAVPTTPPFIPTTVAHPV